MNSILSPYEQKLDWLPLCVAGHRHPIHRILNKRKTSARLGSLEQKYAVAGRSKENVRQLPAHYKIKIAQRG